MRELERFKARSRDGSYEDELVILQEDVDAGSRRDPAAAARGFTHVQTADGLTCTHAPDGGFFIAQLDLVVYRAAE